MVEVAREQATEVSERIRAFELELSRPDAAAHPEKLKEELRELKQLGVVDLFPESFLDTGRFSEAATACKERTQALEAQQKTVNQTIQPPKVPLQGVRSLGGEVGGRMRTKEVASDRPLNLDESRTLVDKKYRVGFQTGADGKLTVVERSATRETALRVLVEQPGLDHTLRSALKDYLLGLPEPDFKSMEAIPPELRAMYHWTQAEKKGISRVEAEQALAMEQKYGVSLEVVTGNGPPHLGMWRVAPDVARRILADNIFSPTLDSKLKDQVRKALAFGGASEALGLPKNSTPAQILGGLRTALEKYERLAETPDSEKLRADLAYLMRVIADGGLPPELNSADLANAVQLAEDIRQANSRIDAGLRVSVAASAQAYPAIGDEHLKDYLNRAAQQATTTQKTLWTTYDGKILVIRPGDSIGALKQRTDAIEEFTELDSLFADKMPRWRLSNDITQASAAPPRPIKQIIADLTAKAGTSDYDRVWSAAVNNLRSRAEIHAFIDYLLSQPVDHMNESRAREQRVSEIQQRIFIGLARQRQILFDLWKMEFVDAAVGFQSSP